jgi:phosphopentomutase
VSRRAILVVLDGLGVGALPDVPATRPQDAGTDSLAHALREAPAELPFLVSLGLGNAAPSSGLAPQDLPAGSWGRCELGYPGADSFLGHQVLMGGDIGGVRLVLFAAATDACRSRLADRGYDARPLDGGPALMVDDAILVADSLEADPGLNYNVTGSLGPVGFDRVCAVAEVVRDVARVPRVIAVGAHDTPPERLFEGVHERAGAIGIDTPALGIYDRGAEIVHYGIPDLETDRQLPSLAAAAGLPVTLVGKMADIVTCEAARRLPAVETARVLSLLRDAVGDQPDGLIAANVQELDLAGHRESAREYVSVLVQSDAALAALQPLLGEDDLLIVTGDHGNDPTQGAMHTREAVPILALAPAARAQPIALRSSLADIGATLAEWLDLPPTATGTPFLEPLP